MRQYSIWESSTPVRHSTQLNTHQNLHVDSLEEVFRLLWTETNWLLPVHCALLFILESLNVYVYTAIFFLPYFYSPNAANPHSTLCECQIKFDTPTANLPSLMFLWVTLRSERRGARSAYCKQVALLCVETAVKERVSHSLCARDLGRSRAQSNGYLWQGNPRGRAHVSLPFLSVRFNSVCIGASGSVVVETLCYKPEGRGFETRWGEWIF
jgi:hypothetical protein